MHIIEKINAMMDYLKINSYSYNLRTLSIPQEISNNEKRWNNSFTYYKETNLLSYKGWSDYYPVATIEQQNIIPPKDHLERIYTELCEKTFNFCKENILKKITINELIINGIDWIAP